MGAESEAGSLEPEEESGNKSCQISAISCQQKEMKDLKDLPLFLQTPDYCLQTFPAAHQISALCALYSALFGQ